MSELSEFVYALPPGTAWEYSASIAQITSTPSVIDIQILVPAGEILWIDNIFIQTGTVASARAVQMVHSNSDGNNNGKYMGDTLDTNQFIHAAVAAIEGTGNTQAGVGFPFLPFLLYPGQALLFSGVSFVNEELYTIRLLGRLLSGIKLVTNTHITAPINATTLTEVTNLMSIGA